MSEKVFKENRQIFLERCPEAFFFLPHLNRTPHALGAEKKQKEQLEQWLLAKNLSDVDLLYVYGTGLGCPYLVFKHWLEKKKQRELVFLEENSSHLASFLSTKHAKECLTHPRVHFFLYEKERREEALQEVAHQFPISRIELVAAFPHKEEELFEIRLVLFRKTTLAEAFLSDTLFSHRHFANFLPNLKQIASSSLINQMKGRFKKIPALICGAGASLQEAISFFPEVQQKALVIAGGSAIAALSSQGILPHIAMAFDPNFEEFLRMKSSFAFETPFFFATRLFHEAFATCNGPLGYVRSAIGGLEELWMDEKLSLNKKGFVGEKLSPEALSVTTVAIALARYLGADPIILAGVDLSYKDLKRYAEGVVIDNHIHRDEMERGSIASDRIFARKNLKKEKIYTTTKWLMESSVISSYAKEFPSTRFFTTSDALCIDGIPFISWEDLIEKELKRDFDLSSYLHAEMAQSRFSQDAQKKLDRMCKGLKKSFVRCAHLIEKILQELEAGSGFSGKMVLFEMDLQEEDAFLYFLSELPLAIDRVLERKYRGSCKSDPQVALQRTKEKWKQMLQAAQDHVAVFSP